MQPHLEDAAAALPLGFVISMESADSIPAPDRLSEFWDAGVRVIGPAHYGPGRYAGGTGTELGLTDIGGALLDEMARLGVILDLTHFSDQSFWQALERFDGPVLASHNNCRALGARPAPVQRRAVEGDHRARRRRGRDVRCHDARPGLELPRRR